MSFVKSPVETKVESDVECIALPDGLRLVQSDDGLALVGDEKRQGLWASQGRVT